MVSIIPEGHRKEPVDAVKGFTALNSKYLIYKSS